MKKQREELIKEYEQFVMIEDKMAEDILLGKRAEDLSFEIDAVDIMYNKKRICAELFAQLEPRFKEFSDIAKEVYDLAREKECDLEELEIIKERCSNATEVLERVQNMIYYDSDDLNNIDLMMNEIDVLNRNGNRNGTVEAVTNTRILINLSKIVSFEDYKDMCSLLENAILRLNEKKMSLLSRELGDDE